MIDVDLGYRNVYNGYITNLTDKRFIIKHQVYYKDKVVKKISKKGYKFIDTYWLLNYNFPTNYLFHSRKLDLQLYDGRMDSYLCHYDGIKEICRMEVPRLKMHAMGFDSLYNANFLKDTNIIDEEINEIAHPFFMKTTVVSNKDYKDFYLYTLDSVAKEECYKNSVKALKEKTAEVSIKKILEILDLSKSDIKKLLSNVDEINFDSLRSIGFRKERLDFYDRDYMPFIANIYLPDYERFYKRREVDKRLIHYRYQDEEGNWIKTNLMYDSLNFVRRQPTRWNHPYTNMFHWHPAYHNYPIINISLEQAKAYCHYMTKKLNEEDPLELYNYKVELPSYYNYEWALINKLENKNVYFDPFFGEDLSDTLDYYNPYDTKFYDYLPYKKFDQFVRNTPIPKVYWGRYAKGITFGNNVVSEMTKDTLSDYFKTNLLDYWSYRTYLKSGHTRAQESIEGLKESGHLVLGGNWAYPEAQNYFGVNAKAVLKERYVTATEKNTKMGFRTVIYLIPKSVPIETEKK